MMEMVGAISFGCNEFKLSDDSVADGAYGCEIVKKRLLIISVGSVCQR
jgi:hypothetical protein